MVCAVTAYTAGWWPDGRRALGGFVIARKRYTLCSLAADLRVTQTVDVNKGIHCVLRKEHFPARQSLGQPRL